MKTVKGSILHQFLVSLSFDAMRGKRDLVNTGLDHDTDTLWRQKLPIGGKADERNFIPLPERHQGGVVFVYSRLHSAADVKLHRLRKEHLGQTPDFPVGESLYRVL